MAEESASTAIELLTAYSVENAAQYAPHFRYTDHSRIVSVNIHAVGMNNTTARYSGQEAAWSEVNNILRIRTADGYEGISGVDSYYQGPHSDEHLRELASILPTLVRLGSVDPVIVAERLAEAEPGLSDTVRASIDIALWDLAARRAERPLYQLLGGQRRSIDAYASLPFYETVPEHIEAVRANAALGFSTFKFHVWGSIEDDLRLVTRVQDAFAGSNYRFMIDLEGMYGIEDALRLGRKMDEGLFTVLEGPIDDALLAEYADLRDSLGVQLIPAGYTYYSSDYIREAIAAEAWDAGRFDATVVGGISAALVLLIITDAANLPVEIQSWGHSLAQVANLHLMLASERTPYFEVPVPYEVFDFGMKNGDLLDGSRAVVPDGFGLGVEVEWERLPAADFHVHRQYDFADQSN